MGVRVTYHSFRGSGGQSKNMWAFYLIIFVVGFAFIGGGLWNLISKQTKIDGYVKIEAYVQDYKESVSSHYDDNGFYHETTTYAEIVSYYVDGKVYFATNNVSSSSPKRIGSKIEIAYDPQDPSDCIFVNSTYQLTIILMCVGGISFIIGFIMLALDIKKRNQN